MYLKIKIIQERRRFHKLSIDELGLWDTIIQRLEIIEDIQSGLWRLAVVVEIEDKGGFFFSAWFIYRSIYWKSFKMMFYCVIIGLFRY